LSQSSYSWQVDEVTDVQDNKLFYDYLTKTTDEPVQNATPPTGATWTLYTTKTRIHEITYNLDSVSAPQSRIEFRSSGDNLSANTFTNRLESIYIYEGGSSTPRVEYRLDAENKTVGSPGCLNYDMTPYAQRQNNTVILNAIQMVTGTDSNPATNDTPLTSMPATTFTHSYKPHFFKNSQPCFQFYYLTGVDNGYGGDFTFSYLSDGRSHGIYTQHGAAWYEYPTVGYSYVVDVLTRDDGQTSPTTVEYAYHKPCYNQNYSPNSTTFSSEFACIVGEVSDYNGPLIGFNRVIVTPKNSNGNALSVSRSYFHQDEDRQGRPYDVRTYQPNGSTVVSRVRSFYTTETLVTGIDFTYLDEQQNIAYQNSWYSDKVVTSQEFGYNTGMQGGTQYGNQTVVWDYGNDNDSSDDRTIVTCFYPNDSMHWADNWIVSLPSAVRVFDGIEPASGIANRCNSSYTINLLSETRTVYDWDGSGAPNYNNYTNVPELGLVTTTFAGKYGDSGLHGSTNGFIQGQTFTYDSYGNPTTIVNENGLTTTVNYDNDLNMYPVSVTVNNSDIAARTTQYAFYGINGVTDSANGLDMPMGAVRKITDPNGLDQIFEYDPFGRLHAIYEKESDRSPYISIPADNSAWDGDPVSRYRYWDNTWNSSMYSGWTSDPMLITEETRPYSFADSPSSTPGFVSRMATHVYYDGFGREIQIQGTDFSVDGLSGDQNLVSLIGYHANGQVDCQSVTFAVPYNTGFVTDSCSSKAHTSTEFDSQGRTTRVTGPDGNSSEMEYYIYADPFGSSSNVFLTNVFDANGHGKGSVTNARGELIQVIDFSGNSPSTYDHYGYVNYQYDKLGNLTQVDTIQPADSPDMQGSINPIVLTTQIQYDVLGRKVWMDDPDMGVWNYYYDAQGNLVKQHDANQDRICFYYDSLGRVTGKSGQDNPQCPSSLPARNTNGWLASYLYDQGANALGQLTRVEWERNGSYDYESFTYDNESRLDDHTRVIEGHSYVVTNSSFDVLHRPTSINNAYGENITLTYDHEGLDTLQAGSNMLVTGVEFNERRQMTVMSFQNGVDTTYSYFGASENFRLQQVEVETTSSSTLHLDFNYTYDDVGNILSITDNSLYVNSGKGGGSYTTRDTQTFGYDELNRLISADGVHDDNALNYALDYEYDAFGNITKVIDGGIARTYTYDYSGGAQPVHGVQSISDGSSFNYDANGNMFDRDDSTGDYTHVYDRENRLIEVTNNGNGDQIEFFYDATGQRTMSIFDDGSSSETTHYPFADYTVENPGSGSAEVKRVTYSFGGQQVAVRVVENGSNTMSYLHTDHLGSSSVSTNGSGAEVANSRSSFLPFGGERLVSTADLNQRGFTGHYENRDFGLTYMNARFYLPEIGRFATADTLIPNALLSQHYNRYTYTSNNPIIYTDPTGHCEEGYMGDDYEDFDCIEAAQTVAQNLGADILYINFNPWKPIKSLNESQTVNVYELGWDSVEQANDLIDKYDALLTTFEHTSEWNNELDGMLAEADKTSLERSEYLEELYDGTFTNWVTDLTEELVEHTLSDDLAYGVVDYRVPDSAVQMLGQRSRQAGRIIGSGMEQTSHIVVEYFYAHMMTDGAYVGASIGRFGNVTRTFYRLEQYSDALPPLSTSN
ncbi:MAG: RHS repeat-associated core domain-containing protein, partial [Chloroflexota bacterium]